MHEQQRIKVKPGQLTNVFCSDKDCRSPFFGKTYVLKKIPATLSPTGKAFVQPIELYVCRDCGGVIGEMMPDGAVVGIPEKLPENGVEKQKE